MERTHERDEVTYRAVARVRAERISELVKEIATLRTATADLRTQLDTSRASHKAAETEARQATKEVARLRAKLVAARSTARDSRAKYDALRKRRSVRLAMRLAKLVPKRSTSR